MQFVVGGDLRVDLVRGQRLGDRAVEDVAAMGRVHRRQARRQRVDVGGRIGAGDGERRRGAERWRRHVGRRRVVVGVVTAAEEDQWDTRKA